jgi:hypothetical protein
VYAWKEVDLTVYRVGSEHKHSILGSKSDINNILKQAVYRLGTVDETAASSEHANSPEELDLYEDQQGFGPEMAEFASDVGFDEATSPGVSEIAYVRNRITMHFTDQTVVEVAGVEAKPFVAGAANPNFSVFTEKVISGAEQFAKVATHEMLHQEFHGDLVNRPREDGHEWLMCEDCIWLDDWGDRLSKSEWEMMH